MPDSEKTNTKNFSAAEVEILLELQSLRLEMVQLRESTQKNVSRVEFEPIQRLVYGMVGVVLLAFATGVVALVFIK